MAESWKVTVPCNRETAERLTIAEAEGDAHPVIVGSEIDEAADLWQIEGYFERKPTRADIRAMLGGAAVDSGAITVERLPDQDWVTLSQASVQPVRAGRFLVHTATNRGVAADDHPARFALQIDAAQAFGTGTHDTTAGCLSLIDALARSGHRFSNIIDIGTGTGLLALATARLWPTARITASDIDPVSIDVTRTNLSVNGAREGFAPGRIRLAVAAGTQSSVIASRAPYDLIIANILAGPLIALAPDVAAIAEDGTTLILAGLLNSQQEAVAAAYRAHGFALVAAFADGDWPVLYLTKRAEPHRYRPRRARHRGHASDATFGSW